MSNRVLAYLQLTAAMISVGSTVVASEIIGRGLDPIVAAAMRFAIAAPIYWLLMRETRTRLPRPSWPDVALLIGQAATGSVGYTILLIAGTRMTSATDAGIIIGTLPAAAALTAAAALRESLRVYTIGAVILATAGVVLGTLPAGGHLREPHSLLGDGLVLGAVFCESGFILLNKRLSAPWPPLAQATAMTTLGFAISAALAIPEVIQPHPVWPLRPLLGVIYYALIPTVGGFWLWYSGASRVSGSEAAVFTAVAPASGVILSALILGDPLTPSRLGGLALVLAAVFATAASDWSRRRADALPDGEAQEDLR